MFVPYGCSPYLTAIAHTAFSAVIANQSGDWCGNPYPLRGRSSYCFQFRYALGDVDGFGCLGYTIYRNILDFPLGHFSPLCQKIEDVFIYLTQKKPLKQNGSLLHIKAC